MRVFFEIKWAPFVYCCMFFTIFDVSIEYRMHLGIKIKQVCFFLHSVFTIFEVSHEYRMHLGIKIKQVCFFLHSVFTIFDVWS